MHPGHIDENRRRKLQARQAAGSRELESMPYLGAAVPVGLVGSALVAIYVLALDLLAGHPFGTPNALGALLFRGEPFSLDSPVHPGLVLGYTLLHGATFISIAAAAVSTEFTLTRQGVAVPIQLASGVVGIFVALQVVFVALSFLIDVSWSRQLGFERVVVSNAIAALGMATTVYLRGEGRRAVLVPVLARANGSGGGR